jgi:enoyl-CoA hydratase
LPAGAWGPGSAAARRARAETLRPGQVYFKIVNDQFEHVLVEREDAVAVVTLSRPKVLNALSSQTLDELRRAVLALGHDGSVRSIVITGAGEKAFVENLGKPVVAAINGFALGGGCELAMACTLRVAADSARLGQPEINLGLIPGYGGTQRLARLIGTGAALDLLLTGRQVAADEALRLGLVDRVVPAAELMAEARKLAALLASKAPVAVRCILDAVRKGVQVPLAQAQALEAALFGLVFSTDDMREGTRAFLEKRQPDFKGT